MMAAAIEKPAKKAILITFQRVVLLIITVLQILHLKISGWSVALKAWSGQLIGISPGISERE